jgi:hypothetical protein
VTSLTESSPGAPPASPAGRVLPLTLGRRLALAFGVPAAVFMIAISGFDLVGNLGRASFPVSRTLPLAGGHFTLNDDGGDVDLRGAPAVAGTAPAARVTGTVYYSLVRPNVFWDDGTGGSPAGVRLGCPLASLTDCALNAHVNIPAGTVVTASTGGGNMTASGLSSTVSLSTGGGDVHASHLSGFVSVNTSGGNVTVDQLSGTTRLHTSGGDITGTSLTARDVKAETDGGNVRLTLTAVPSDLDVRTSGGDVTIIVPPGVSYDVNAVTGGGNVSDTVNRSSDSPYKISATTSGGNITIRDSAA